MSGYRKPYGSYNRRGQTAGQRMAKKHIEEARLLSRELGGTDRDVKNYFFSLSRPQLKKLYSSYGERYGNSAKNYAMKTYPKWRSGQTQMSGLVASRLFEFLPPLMPIDKKHELVESLWSSVETSTHKALYVGLNADLEELSRRIGDHFNEVAIHHKIPEQIEARYNWLSQGDVATKQKLMSFFREKESVLVDQLLRKQVPILIKNFRETSSSLTKNFSQELKVGKHTVRVELNEKVDGISDTRPKTLKDFVWIFWFGAFIALCYFQFK